VSVEADESNPFLGIELEAGTFKENLRTKAFVEIFNTDHILPNGKSGLPLY
jgi:hypothetical protein